MTYEQIQEALESLGLPTCYYQFEEDTEQAPPFLCWYIPGSNGFFADNKVYCQLVDITVELYTEDKRWDLEAALEEILNNNELPFQKTESYIDSEKLFLQTYETEVFIHGEQQG